PRGPAVPGFRAACMIGTLLIVGACAPMPSPATPRLGALTSPPPESCGTDPRTLRCPFLTDEPKFVETPGARVAYQVFGHAPPLLLIHGWPLNRFTWRNLLPSLADHFTVYAVDVPGAGDTVWSDDTDFTWPGQAKTLKAFVAALGLGRYLVFAQDSGAV